MELLTQFIDIFLHLDQHLGEVIQNYGTTTYVLLMVIVFCETGLVVTPFLPGDSLLFAAGALAATTGVLSPHALVVCLLFSAVVGDGVNYHVGKYLGPRVFTEKIPFLKRDYLLKTEEFYERHGGKTIIIARFMPIIRTFAPFVAGIGSMSYPRFLAYNVIGGILWVTSFIYAGYFFGNIPAVKKNFTLVIMGIIVVSVLPGVVEYLRHRFGQKGSGSAPQGPQA